MRTSGSASGAGAGHYTVLGGAGFVGSWTARILRSRGARVVVVDRRPPPAALTREGVQWLECDVLCDEVELPPGHVVVSLGSGNPRPRWMWTLPLELPITTARVASQLAGRDVTLISSIEAYGSAAEPLAEDVAPVLPWRGEALDDWCRQAMAAAGGPCQPWRVARLCRSLAAGDPTGRWVYGASKLLQEAVVRAAVPAERLTVLRLANTFGIGQERVVAHLIRRALAGRELRVTSAVRSFVAVEDVAHVVLRAPGPGTFNVSAGTARLADLAYAIRDACGSDSAIELLPAPVDDSCGRVDATRLAACGVVLEDVFAGVPRMVRSLAEAPPLFAPALAVVVPPRPVRPDELADRQQSSLWSGRIKAGNRWSRELARGLAERLEIEQERLLLTTSGTDALRLAVVATAGPARAGDVAAVPSFTFPATAEAVAQLGYDVRFVDVDPQTWTMDPADLERVVAESPVRVVVVVDTFGNPAGYDALRAICRARGIALVADSAAALGSRCAGRPVARQADAHAFSMSFAKTLSAGGAGGAVVLPAGADLGHWTRSKLMHELHAASALDQLAVFDDALERRAAVARVYAGAVGAFALVDVQRVRRGDRHSHVHWVLRLPAIARGRFVAALADLGIETRDYFQALHRIGWRTDRLLPVTARLHEEVVAVPMSSELTLMEAECVAVGLDWALREALAPCEQQPAPAAQDVVTAAPAVERRAAGPVRAARAGR